MTTAEVRLWGTTIGAVTIVDGEKVARFRYDKDFIESGIELSPIVMPLSNNTYEFPELNYYSFTGLPGLLADSLPDKFGNSIIDAWLESQGRSRDSFNSVERLCYAGTRGMGALEFKPNLGPRTRKSTAVHVDRLVELASEILDHRNSLVANIAADKQLAMKEILCVGTSAGGARAKAVIAWNQKTNEVRTGEVKADQNFEYWLMKFDGVSGNKDKELEDPKGYGLIEYAYYRMAIDSGILMSECRIFKEGIRNHFVTKRFDRLDGGEKIHMQSLGAIAHLDYHNPGIYSYEQAVYIMRNIGLETKSVEQMFRRMAFNIIARNQDDHVKNIAFLMNKKGEWSLSPAFDVTYSYQPGGEWTSKHQMSMNGKIDDFNIDDFRTCGKTVGLKRGRAEKIVEEIKSVVSNWRDYADDAGVDPVHRNKISNSLRLSI